MTSWPLLQLPGGVAMPCGKAIVTFMAQTEFMAGKTHTETRHRKDQKGMMGRIRPLQHHQWSDLQTQKESKAKTNHLDSFGTSPTSSNIPYISD